MLSIFNSLARNAAAAGFSSHTFSGQRRSLVVVLFREIALVAGAAFANGVACAEWAAAVLVAGA